MTKVWKIEYLTFDNKWKPMRGFEYMGKSYAQGAWAMLRAHYNHKNKHRLVNGDVVVADMGCQFVCVSERSK